MDDITSNRGETHSATCPLYRKHRLPPTFLRSVNRKKTSQREQLVTLLADAITRFLLYISSSHGDRIRVYNYDHLKLMLMKTRSRVKLHSCCYIIMYNVYLMLMLYIRWLSYACGCIRTKTCPNIYTRRSCAEVCMSFYFCTCIIII